MKKQTLIKSPRFAKALALTGVLALSLTACGSGTAAPEESSAPQGGAGASAPYYDQLPQEIKDAGKIRVGMSPTGTPFSMKPGEEFEGMLPELSDAAEKLLGVEMEIISTAFPAQIPSLQAGKIDMIWGASADSVEREKVLDFVSYLRSPMKPVMLKDTDLSISTEEDLCGVKVGAVQGGDIHRYLETVKTKCEESGTPMELNLYEASSAAMAQLQAGKVEAMIGMGAIQDYIAATAEDGGLYRVESLEVLPTIYGMAFEKGDTELQTALRDALRELVNDGSYEEVLTKYHAASGALTADEILINGVGSGELK